MKKSLCLLLLSVGVVALVGLADHALAANCGGVKVSDALGNCPNAKNPIYALIARLLKFATGAFGLIFVLMIVIAGLQYVVSGGSPDTAKAAKERLRNAITGFVLFVIMWGALQVILPPDVRVFG